MSDVFVGDVGTEILLDTGVDISAATVAKIKVKKPTGAALDWTATISGTRSVRYVIQTGDLDVAGRWKLQAYVEMPGWKGRGDWVCLQVAD